MKFCSITYFRNSLCLSLIVFVQGASMAQKGTQSPYSIFGIGELNQGQYAAFMGMGGISIANSDSTIANNGNPALYAYTQRYRPILQVGLSGKLSSFTTGSDATTQRTMGLNQIQLALPIKKRWGASFGMLPYSFTGYTITGYQITNGDTLSQAVNEGAGAISKFYLGLGYKMLDHSRLDVDTTRNGLKQTIKTHVFSLGANGNVLFGSSTKIQSYEFLTNVSAYNSRVTNSLRISDVCSDFGLNYQYYFRPAKTDTLMNGSISLGLTYAPGFKLRAYQDLYSHNYLGSFYGGQTFVLDTVEYVDNYKGSVFIPEQYKFGFEYRMGWKPSRKGERLLRIGVEANFQKWSSYYEDFGSQTFAPYYKDRLSLGFGLEYCPVLGNDPSVSILSRSNYRFGLNYTQTELSVNSTDLNNYGMTFGIGIPMNVNQTNTSLNFGATLGSMGTTNSGLISEKYLGFYFGISIIPDRNELWFLKRKYD